jgi:hypothetical protein
MEQIVGRKTLVYKKAGMGIHENTYVMKKDATKEHNNQDTTNTLIIICHKLACNRWCALPKNITISTPLIH